MVQNFGTMFLEKHYQSIAALSATISVISLGMHYGWASPMIPFLNSEDSHIRISSGDEIWLEMSHFIGSIIILPLTGFLTDKFGRKSWILMCSVVNVAVWLILAFAKNVIELYVGRILTGVCGNILFIVGPVYATEISEARVRGFHVGLFDAMLWFGIVIMYATGPFLPFYVPPLIGIATLVMQLVIFWFMPESPYYLISRGREEAAKISLKKFRRGENVDSEHESIANALRVQNEESRGVKKQFFKKSTLKTFFIVTFLVTAQMFSGFAAILMNLHTILKEADSIYIEPNYSSIIYAVLSLIAVTTSTFFVDRFGRKILLIFSSFMTCLSVLALGVYVHLKNLDFDMSVHSWIPVASVFAFAITFNIGFLIVPKVVASEMLPNELRSIGMCYVDGLFVIMGLLSLLFYKDISTDYGTHVPYYVFAGVAFSTIVFTVCMIRENKMKSLLQIQAELQQ